MKRSEELRLLLAYMRDVGCTAQLFGHRMDFRRRERGPGSLLKG